MEPTRQIAEFTTGFGWNSLPVEAMERAREALMDYVGVALAGVNDESSVIVRELVEELGGAPQASVWGTRIKTSVTHAALANGTAAHALDLDDTNVVMMAHPSIQVLPALLALGEYTGACGKDILLSYVIGFEVGGSLGRALNPDLVRRGWFPVGLMGALMQTAACARLVNLNTQQIQNAIGIASNLAGGLRCNNGTMAKPLAAGGAAAKALLAVLSAAKGLSANTGALESRFGVVENFGGGDVAGLREAVKTLGISLEIMNSGLAYKLYPCCAGAHAAIDCALQIARAHRPNPEDIQEIAVSISSGVKFLLIHPRPKTGSEAKFSLEYCVARALLDGRIGPTQFDPQKIGEPELESMIEKVKPEYHDELTRSVRVAVLMKNGDAYAADVEHPRGTPENPLSRGELEQKFVGCAKAVLSETQVEAAADLLEHFEEVSDVGDLSRVLTGDGGAVDAESI